MGKLNISQFKILLQEQKINEIVNRFESDGMEISKDFSIRLNYTNELGELKPALIDILRNSLFQPDTSDEENLKMSINNIFFLNPGAMNYIIYSKRIIVGVAQSYKCNFTGILNGIGFLNSIRRQGIYSLMNCMRFIVLKTQNCKYVSGITSNPIVLKKLDGWDFFYSPQLFFKIHIDEKNNSSLYNELSRIAIEVWTEIGSIVDENSLIIKKENIPHGRFIVERTQSSNDIFNDYISNNIRMGDRMILIKTLDEDLIQKSFNDFLKSQLTG